MIQTNTCRYCSGAQALIASSHPSGLGQALNLGRAVIPWAGLPSPGEPGGRPGVMVTVTSRVSRVTWIRVDSGIGVPGSDPRTAGPLTANAEAMAALWAGHTVRNQLETRTVTFKFIGSRRGRGRGPLAGPNSS